MKSRSAHYTLVEQMRDPKSSVWLLWDVVPFLHKYQNLSPVTRQQPSEIVNDRQDLQDICIELGAIVDAGVHFVNAT